MPLRWVVRLLLLVGVFVAGALATWAVLRPPPFQPPAAPVVVEKVRAAARLETLDVRVYKKVSFAPGPQPSGSVWGDLAEWVKHTVRAPEGKAIVFAVVHYGVDLSKLSAERVAVQGERVVVSLPDVRASVELLPGETEVLGSNLDSAQTAELFELARRGFEVEAGQNEALRTQARMAAELAVERVLRALGFREVVFSVRRAPAG
ncbi:MAG: DUF4230 domain-containing protein [Myxococcota bacterium]